MEATEIAIIAEGFESGPPSENLKELMKESTNMAVKLPMSAVQIPRLIEEESWEPKINVAKELA
jgi:hypothetical protein